MGVDPLLLRNIYRQYGITDEELKNQMRVFVPFEVHDSPLNVIEIKGENWKEDLDKFLEAGKQFIEQTKQPPIFLLGADSLKTIYGEERCEQILNLCATEVRRMGAVAIYNQSRLQRLGNKAQRIGRYLYTSNEEAWLPFALRR
jgi:hypothetical protein